MIVKFSDSIKEILSFKRIAVFLIGLSIAFLAYRLRVNQFFSFPPVGDTQDEIKYTFNGISLIKNNIPESWSWWDDYGKFPTINIRGNNYRLVKPYFDEPPLFGLMSGAYAISKGMDSLEKVDAGAMRWPMLKLGALNVLLLFILVYQLSGFFQAVIASLIYATVPAFVLSARLPFAENFLVTLSLVCLILVWQYLRKNNWWLLWLAAIFSSSAILVKQVGIFLPVTLVFLFFSVKKKKEAGIVVLSTLAFVGIWLLYGAYYDWGLFVKLLGKFSGREMRLPNIIIHSFDTFRITEKTMSVDGWQIFGWVSLAALSFFRLFEQKPLNKEKKDRLRIKMNYLMPTVAVGTYITLLMVMSGHIKGWYRFPMFPFISWVIAVFFVNFLRNPSFIFTFFFATLPVASSWITGTGEAFFSEISAKIFQFVFLLLMAPCLLFELKKSSGLRFFSRATLILLFIAAIVLNVRTILFFQDQFWY